jgi:aspartyl/asparaginyl beta-hydroxylase (cupin superfamily)
MTLAPHTGWEDLANHVLRIHVPLIVPSCCGTWVEGCVRIHQEGIIQAFDDSKVHRAFNYNSTEERIVLIIDLARPPTLPIGTAIGGHTEELDNFIEQMT